MVREVTGFPPFNKLATIFFTARNRNQVADYAMRAKKFLDTVSSKNQLGLEVLGPAPVGIEKRANQFTWNIICRSESYQVLYLALKKFDTAFAKEGSISVKIDLNPYFYC